MRILPVILALAAALNAQAKSQYWNTDAPPSDEVILRSGDSLRINLNQEDLYDYLKVNLLPISGNPEVELNVNGFSHKLSFSNRDLSRPVPSRTIYADPSFTVCRGHSRSADLVVISGAVKVLHVGSTRTNQKAHNVTDISRNGTVVVNIQSLQRDPVSLLNQLGTRRESFVTFNIENQWDFYFLASSGEERMKLYNGLRHPNNRQEIAKYDQWVAKKHAQRAGDFCKYISQDSSMIKSAEQMTFQVDDLSTDRDVLIVKSGKLSKTRAVAGTYMDYSRYFGERRTALNRYFKTITCKFEYRAENERRRDRDACRP